MENIKDWLDDLRENSPMAFWGGMIALSLFVINNISRFTGKKGKKAAKAKTVANKKAVKKEAPKEEVVRAVPIKKFPSISEIPAIDFFYLQRIKNRSVKMSADLAGYAPAWYFLRPFYKKSKKTEEIAVVYKAPKVHVLPTLKYQGFFVLNNRKQAILKDETNRIVYAHVGDVLPGTPYRVDDIGYREVQFFDLQFKKPFEISFAGSRSLEHKRSDGQKISTNSRETGNNVNYRSTKNTSRSN